VTVTWSRPILLSSAYSIALPISRSRLVCSSDVTRPLAPPRAVRPALQQQQWRRRQQQQHDVSVISMPRRGIHRVWGDQGTCLHDASHSLQWWCALAADIHFSDTDTHPACMHSYPQRVNNPPPPTHTHTHILQDCQSVHTHLCR
jgi:hypothetical protein